MRRNITILVIIGILLSSCGAQTATQVTEVATEESVITPATQTPVTPEPVVLVTEELIATEPPTAVPTESSPVCVTLLEPIDGIDLPATGKAIFTWTPMDEAGSYVLNFILPSGAVASFETNQTFLDRYMEAFVSGGEYQWQVTAKGSDSSNICISEIFTFEKPAYEKPKSDRNDGGNSGTGDEWTPPPQPTSDPD